MAPTAHASRGSCDERLADMDYVLLSAADQPADALDRAASVLGTATAVERLPAADSAGIDDVLAALAGRVMVIAGDDALLRRVLVRAWRKKLLDSTSFALLPLGAAGFARHVGVPADLADAARRIIGGAPRRLDLLRDDQAGIVVDAAYVGAVAADRPQGTLRTLWRSLRPPTCLLRVEVDDHLLADFDPVAAVVIGNGPGISAELALPAAIVDDGLLDVAVLGAPNRSAPKGTAGQRFRPLRRARGRAVNVFRRPDDEVIASADGESAPMRERRCWWVQPSSWTLIC